MAYIVGLYWTCASCTVKRATKEVFDRWNGSVGKFCAACAKRKMKELLDVERKD